MADTAKDPNLGKGEVAVYILCPTSIGSKVQ
jgi:hypothetical protein